MSSARFLGLVIMRVGAGGGGGVVSSLFSLSWFFSVSIVRGLEARKQLSGEPILVDFCGLNC